MADCAVSRNSLNSMKLRYSDVDISALFDDPLIIDVCATSAFRRLRGISFLGAIDKRLGRGAHSRYDHSLGVALLAQHYGKAMGFEHKVRREIVVAALLHDIGHAPLSHTLEPLFVQQFGLDHHIASNHILLGKVRTGSALNALLQRNRLDPERLADLISGNDHSHAGRIFSSPINIDTIEAIWRGHSYFGVKTSHPMTVLDAFITLSKQSTDTLDRFWAAKDYFYQVLVYSSFGMSSDLLARFHVEHSDEQLTPQDFFSSEAKFLKKFCSETPTPFPACEVTGKARRFSVDSTQALNSHEKLRNRYRAHKYEKIISLDSHSWRVKKRAERAESHLLFAA